MRQPDHTDAEPDKLRSITELFAALESPLLRYALGLTDQRDLAEEWVQDAFMRLHAHFDQVRQPRAWLYRTVHNLALNHQRRARRLVPLQPPGAAPSALTGERAGLRPENPHNSNLADVADPHPLPDEQIARAEALGLVRLALDALDPRSRQLVRLKFEQGLSYKEMSACTGLTVGHVGYLLHHALKTIAAELARAGLVP